MNVVAGRVKHWVDRWWLLERLRAADADEIAVDLGTGDGAYVIRTARARPKQLVIGIDSNADGLAVVSRKALRKPVRGGVPNAMFVHASVETLPDALAGLVLHLTILLPWGSLLRGVAEPDPVVLAGARSLCRPGASLDVVMGYDGDTDTKTAALAPLTREYLHAVVLPRYRDAGFEGSVAPLGREELRSLGTTWAGRLAFGRARRFWRIAARAI